MFKCNAKPGKSTFGYSCSFLITNMNFFCLNSLETFKMLCRPTQRHCQRQFKGDLCDPNSGLLTGVSPQCSLRSHNTCQHFCHQQFSTFQRLVGFLHICSSGSSQMCNTQMHLLFGLPHRDQDDRDRRTYKDLHG